MNIDHFIRYQVESVAWAKLATVKRHSKPVEQTTQQTAGAAA